MRQIALDIGLASGPTLANFFAGPNEAVLRHSQLWMGERIGLHPLAVIFALLAFGQLFGFVGVLVALPASAVLLVAMRRARAAYLASRLYQA